MIYTYCDKCGAKLEAPDNMKAQKAFCPVCGGTNVLSVDWVQMLKMINIQCGNAAAGIDLASIERSKIPQEFKDMLIECYRHIKMSYQFTAMTSKSAATAIEKLEEFLNI